ncbi:MAG: hypothetical protein QGI94_05595 [Candidatus Scalindua sp.]|nr:hypothetical protein [Candidatus Scalindua sp.]
MKQIANNVYTKIVDSIVKPLVFPKILLILLTLLPVVSFADSDMISDDKSKEIGQSCPLVRCDNIRNIFQSATSIYNRPPIHRTGCSPWVHVSRNPDKNISAISSNLAQYFRE